MTDIEAALRAVAQIGSTAAGSLPPLQSKQDLLLVLLENEHTRLVVWLFPLDHERKHRFFSGHTSRTSLDVRKTLLSACPQNSQIIVRNISAVEDGLDRESRFGGAAGRSFPIR